MFGMAGVLSGIENQIQDTSHSLMQAQMQAQLTKSQIQGMMQAQQNVAQSNQLLYPVGSGGAGMTTQYGPLMKNPLFKEEKEMQQFKVGDIVECRWQGSPSIPYFNEITAVHGHNMYSYRDTHSNSVVSSIDFSSYPGSSFVLINKEKPNMLQEIGKDLKKFIVDHKGVIYCIAVILLVDNFFFEGKFRNRLQDMVNKLLNKVESQIDRKVSNE